MTPSNADYWRELDNALETINGHPLFHNMVGEEPHINFGDDTGVLQAGNLFWLDLCWSATPGVPLRLPAAKSLSNTLFKEPTP